MSALSQMSGWGFSGWDPIATNRLQKEEQAAAATAFGRSEMAAYAQMDFQERMSNSAYQRATGDMMAAGLNPMLAYSQGGASTPGGAGFAAPKANITTAGGSGSQTFQTASQVGQAESISNLNSALEAKVEDEINWLRQQEATSAAQEVVHEAEAEKLRAEARIRLVEAESAEKFLIGKTLAELQIIQAKAKGMRTEGEIDDTLYGQILRYINRLVESLGAAILGAAAGAVAGRAVGGRATTKPPASRMPPPQGPPGGRGAIFRRFLRGAPRGE